MESLARRADSLLARYFDHLRRHAPVEATRLGIDGVDGELDDLAPQALDDRVRDIAMLACDVDTAIADAPADAQGVVREARDDLRLLAGQLGHLRFVLAERPRFELDPLAGPDLVAAAIHELLRRLDAPGAATTEMLEAAVQRARRVPRFLEQAGSLLVSAPAPHLALARQRLTGIVALVRDELPRSAERFGADTSPARDAGEVAAEALEAYGALLAELSDEPAGAWRFGPRDHAEVLENGIGARMRAHDVHSRARAWRDHVREDMAELAAAGWSRRFPGESVPVDATERIRRTLDAIAATAVDRDELVAEARRAVDEARAFTERSRLAELPGDVTTRLTDVPAHLSGIAIAFVVPPPALMPHLGSAFHVSPVPDVWSAAQANALLREYHPAQLRSLALHETYPGHVVQIAHALRHERLARRVLTRPVFAEGWAVYIEREARRAGFAHDDAVAVDADDFEITQRTMELRIATNAMLDVGLHAGDLDDPGALELLVSGAFQSEQEAAGKLLRAKVSVGQLASYFIGGEEVGDLRREVEAREGRAFDLRAFHRRLLGHGTPTIDVLAGALADRGSVNESAVTAPAATSARTEGGTPTAGR